MALASATDLRKVIGPSGSRITRLVTIGLDADVGHYGGIQRGHPAASSLSKAGGTSPDTELTSAALAEMSDERFTEVLNELQARGDKAKLMQLFGH